MSDINRRRTLLVNYASLPPSLGIRGLTSDGPENSVITEAQNVPYIRPIVFQRLRDYFPEQSEKLERSPTGEWPSRNWPM